MKRVLFILFAVVLLIGVEEALACSCVSLPNRSLEQEVTEAYQGSSGVFSAKVLSVTEDSKKWNKIVKLRLVKSWKGKLTEIFTIATGLGGGDCGYYFEIGKTYLIYGYRNENKKLETNICTRTSLSVQNKDIAVLDKIKKKT